MQRKPFGSCLFLDCFVGPFRPSSSFRCLCIRSLLAKCGTKESGAGRSFATETKKKVTDGGGTSYCWPSSSGTGWWRCHFDVLISESELEDDCFNFLTSGQAGIPCTVEHSRGQEAGCGFEAM
jgi:hypothetical protein